MTELARLQPTSELVLPHTGEIIPLTDLPAVAGAIRQLRDARRVMAETVAVLEDVLVAESERQGTKTLRLEDGPTAKVYGGPEVTYDVTELVKLLDCGLPEERYRELVQETVSYKVSAAVAKQLAGANPAYARIIEGARSVTVKPYRVSVST